MLNMILLCATKPILSNRKEGLWVSVDLFCTTPLDNHKTIKLNELELSSSTEKNERKFVFRGCKHEIFELNGIFLAKQHTCHYTQNRQRTLISTENCSHSIVVNICLILYICSSVSPLCLYIFCIHLSSGFLSRFRCCCSLAVSVWHVRFKVISI